MANPYRALALGLFGAFGIAAAGAFFAGGDDAPAEAPAPAPLLPAAYATPVEVAHHDTLRRGETLSELLARSALDEAQAKSLLAELARHQDPRTLKPGAVIAYRTRTDDGALRGLEMKLDADRTLEVRPDAGTLTARVAEVPVRADTAVLAGSVTTSLYQALLSAEGDLPRGERQRIADLLADRIFAWQVDFSRDIQVGDRFRVMYERMARPDGTARSGRVLGVEFEVRGRVHDAYLFRTADGFEDYYAGDGESLKRAFLRAPLEFRRISSVFSTARFHPILGRFRAHRGIDYAASSGTPVRAVGDGVVQSASYGSGYGNVVNIRHQRGYASRYAHLRGFAKGIRPGARVRQGDVIGYVGMTGLATGPHLHYEFHENGRAINPTSIRYLTGSPVPAGSRAAFRATVSARVAAMDRESGSTRLAAAPGAASRRGE